MKREDRRLVLDMKKFDIHIFDEFGRYNYLNTQKSLPTHTHPDMIEICYLAKGSQEYFVGEEIFRLLGGDLFLTFPDEVHGTGQTPEEKGILYWMILKTPQKGKDYLGLLCSEASVIFNKLLHTPVRIFKGNDECGKLFRQIFRLYFRDSDTLVKIELNNLLVSLLLNIIRCSEIAFDRRYSEYMMKITHYIDENILGTINLHDLADRCNLSLSRFKHRFKDEVGIPPAEYIIRKKIEKARELIENDMFSIKDIAYDLGFTSPAYFSTVFKQYMGYPPSFHRLIKEK